MSEKIELTTEEIKALRKKLKLTQSQFASFMGIGGSRRIREWESGDNKPNGTAQIILEYCKTNTLDDPFIAFRRNCALTRK